MNGDATSRDRPTRGSLWPSFVALGVAVSEVGVLFGLPPVSVGGLLLLAGSTAGILAESGYVDRPGHALGLLGLLLVGIGLGLVAAGSPSATVRGRSFVIAGATCVPAALYVRAYR